MRYLWSVFDHEFAFALTIKDDLDEKIAENVKMRGNERPPLIGSHRKELVHAWVACVFLPLPAMQFDHEFDESRLCRRLTARDLTANSLAFDDEAAGNGIVTLGPLEAMTPEQFVNPGGSFTLISGTLDEDPIRFGASAAMVSGALNAFVRAAAIEFPAIRINMVSPTVLEESMGTHGPYFRGTEAVPVRRVALAYSKSIEGAQSGQVYRVI